MIRVAGFVLGVCMTLLAFLYFLTPADGPRPAGDAEPVAIAVPDPAPASLAAVDAAPAGAVPEGEPPAVAALSAAFTADALQGITGTGQGPATHVDDSPGASEPVVPGDPPVSGRYVFWSPFRSKWSAEGFAARLRSATDLPVEVVDAGPGKYRVGFRYRDEAERQARVDLIETMTGLELE